MEDIIRISDPGDLIAVVPRLLGFRPRDSIVVLGMNRAERVSMTARLDREDCLLEDVVESMAAAIVNEARRTGAVGVHVIEFAEEPVDWGAEASDPLIHAWRGALEVRDTWVVHRDRYWSPGCTDAACCPPGGRMLPGGFADEQVALGCERIEAELVRRADRRRVRRARTRFVARRARGEASWRRTALAEWTQALRGEVPTVPRLGRLAAGLAVPAVRDAVIVAVFGADGEEQAALLEDRQDARAERRLDAVMHGHLAPVGAEVEQVRAVLRRISDLTAGEERSAALAVTALLDWWAGDQAGCLLAADQALEADGRSRLAALVGETAARGILPGWLRAER